MFFVGTLPLHSARPVPPEDELALSFAIDQILGNPNWRDQMGGAGRVLVEVAFSWDSVTARLGQLYNTLLSQSVLAHYLAPAAV